MLGERIRTNEASCEARGCSVCAALHLHTAKDMHTCLPAGMGYAKEPIWTDVPTSRPVVR